jgi:hypothetical protein
MGCHTWFYKKINHSYNEVKENVINKLNKSLQFYDRMCDGLLDPDLMEAYPEWTPKYGFKYKSIIERQIQIVTKDLCKRAIYNRYTSNNNLTVYVNGNLYEETDYHDIFRKYNYPEDHLYSLQETLDYIQKYKDEITIYDWTFNRLEQFWNQHPNGLIKFG